YTVLQRCIDCVWIFRIDLRTKTVAAVCNEPVRIDNTGSAARLRWPAKTVIILCAAVNVVEGFRVVGGDVVELRYRQILFEVPVLATIVALINTAVTTDEIVIRISRIDPDIVIVDVLVLLAEAAYCATTVIRNHQKDVHYVNAIDVFRIGNDASVVHRTAIEFIAPFPTATAIWRAKDSTTSIGGFHRRIDHVRVDWRDCETN